jgi:putative PIN family toxin of toxin-antitoxin system
MSLDEPRISAVLDANLIVSGTIVRHGIPNQILRAWLIDAFDLIGSSFLTTEVTDVLARPRIRERYQPDSREVQLILDALATAEVQPIDLVDLPVHCRDAKDDPVLACALGGHAGYIVTGDKDLLELDGHPALGPLRIITARAFLDILTPPTQT